MIYFLQNGNPDRVKIGYTANLKNRKREAKTWSCSPLRDLYPPIEGSKADESEIHRLLKSYKINDRGIGDEVFLLCPESLKILDQFRKNQSTKKKSILGPLFEYANQLRPTAHLTMLGAAKKIASLLAMRADLEKAGFPKERLDRSFPLLQMPSDLSRYRLPNFPAIKSFDEIFFTKK